MFETINSAQQIANSSALCADQEQMKAVDNHQGINLNNPTSNCVYQQPLANDKLAENMLQLLTAVNKVSGSQPLHLDRNDISVVVDESFCVKGNGSQHWQCNVCPKFYATKNNLVTHLLGHYGAKEFSCTVCDKTFNQATRLRFHMLTHKGKQPYTCSICQRSFAQMIHLKRHILTHDNKQPYCCKACVKGFALMSELQSHLELHKRQPTINNDFAVPTFGKEPEQPADLKCEVCGRKFLFPSQMKDHMLTHSQVRRFECTICKMKFLKVHHLKAHCLTHSNIRPHKCDLCGRAFTLKGNLIRHLLTHSKERAFECDICGKRFCQRQTLKTHLVMHADTKPFSCPICGKALARAHNLKSHMALHRTEKPYKCPLCNSGFTMKGNLHRHYKEKHKDEIKTTLNLDTQKTGTAIVLSSQYFSQSPRTPKLEGDLKLEGLFNFGTFAHSDHDLPKRRKKTSPKKRKADKRITQQAMHQPPPPHLQHQPPQHQHPLANGDQNCQQIPVVQVANFPGGFGPDRKLPLMHPPNATCNVANAFPTSVLNYFCNDGSCACKFQGQIGYNQHLVHKLHTLHSAIDSLALSSGQPNDKVNAIHVAIDEMANLSQQTKVQQPNNTFC